MRIVRYYRATQRYAVLCPESGSRPIAVAALNLLPLHPANAAVAAPVEASDTPGHFIEAILDGSIAGPVFEYRERFGMSILYRHQASGDTAEGMFAGWQWSRCGQIWTGCDKSEIGSGFHRGFKPHAAHLAIIRFLHFTRPPPPPATATPVKAGAQLRSTLEFDASLKILRGLTSQEVETFFRPRMLKDLLLRGLAHADRRGQVVIQGQPADVVLTDRRVHDWLAWKVSGVDRLTPVMLDNHRNEILRQLHDGRIILGRRSMRRQYNFESVTVAHDGSFLVDGQRASDVFTDDDVRWSLAPGIRIRL